MKSRDLIPADRRWIIGCGSACAALIYAFPLTLPTPLTDPDEGLHAAISQEMVERGDYVVPRFLGKPFLDKPILFFAAQALSLRVFGMNELAARLPGMAFALLGVATSALLAKKLFDGKAALVTAFVACTMILPMAMTQIAVHDVALVPWTNLLVLCAWEMDNAGSRRRRIECGAGAALCIALALLTKGLIGVAVVMSGYGLYAVLARKLSWRLVLRHAAAALGGVLVAGPWFAAVELQSPGYLYYYFVERHVLGFVTESQRHGDEWWFYYLPILLGGGMPWTTYAFAWVRGERGGEPAPTVHAEPKLMLVCWFIGGLAFLTMAGSKLATYAWPLFPSLAIMAGAGISQFVTGEMSDRQKQTFAWILRWTCGLGCPASFATLAALQFGIGASWPIEAWCTVGGAAAAAGAAVILVGRGQLAPAFAVGSSWMAIMLAAITTWPLQPIAAAKTQRPLADRLNQLEDSVNRVVVVGDRPGSLVFYLDPKRREQLRRGRIAERGPGIFQVGMKPASLLAVSTEWLEDDADAATRRRFAHAELVGHFRVEHWPPQRALVRLPGEGTRQ